MSPLPHHRLTSTLVVPCCHPRSWPMPPSSHHLLASSSFLPKGEPGLDGVAWVAKASLVNQLPPRSNLETPPRRRERSSKKGKGAHQQQGRRLTTASSLCTTIWACADAGNAAVPAPAPPTVQPPRWPLRLCCSGLRVASRLCTAIPRSAGFCVSGRASMPAPLAPTSGRRPRPPPRQTRLLELAGLLLPRLCLLLSSPASSFPASTSS